MNQRAWNAVVDIEDAAAVAVVYVRRGVVAAGVDREQVGAGAVDRERSVIVNSPIVSRIVAGPAAVRAGSKWIVSVLADVLASSIASRSEGRRGR